MFPQTLLAMSTDMMNDYFVKHYYGGAASLWHTIVFCNPCVFVAAWCLKNETVQCVLLGATSVEQLYEDIQAIRVGGS